MKVMMFAASLRKDSVNKKLINLAANLLQSAEHVVDLADFSEFDLPLYNADLQEQGFPSNVQSFIERMHSADALIIATPEYNYSLPGTLKNLIDWVSRVNPMPWRNQKVLTLTASPSLVGGNRGAWATRIPLEGCGALVYPDMFSLASAWDAFDEDGQLYDQQLQDRLQMTLAEFVEMVEKLK